MRSQWRWQTVGDPRTASQGTKIEIPLETHGRGNDGWNVVDLSACPRLLSLSFVIPFGIYHAASTGHFACTALAALLSRAPPVLSTVSMQLVRVGEAQPSDLAADLWAVERVLTTRRFTQLQAVNMFIPEWEDMEAFRSAVESVLPTLMEEGLLKLQSRVGALQCLIYLYLSVLT